MLTLRDHEELRSFRHMFHHLNIPLLQLEEFTHFGAHRPEQAENKWIWSTNGQSAEALPEWDLGQPDGKNGTEMCTALKKNYPKRAKLHDQSCSLPMKFLCAARKESRIELSRAQLDYPQFHFGKYERKVLDHQIAVIEYDGERK
jgi:hypothetical protein